MSTYTAQVTRQAGDVTGVALGGARSDAGPRWRAVVRASILTRFLMSAHEVADAVVDARAFKQGIRLTLVRLMQMWCRSM